MLNKISKIVLLSAFFVLVSSIDAQAQTDFEHRTRSEHRQRIDELTYMDVLDLSISTKEAKQMKEDLHLYSEPFSKRHKLCLYGGVVGLSILGGGLMGVAGSEKALGVAGFTCFMAGLVMIWPAIHYKNKAKEFSDKSRMITADATIEPVDFDLGGCHLALGASVMHHETNNIYCIGPSVSIRF